MGAAASVPPIETIKKEIEKLPESFNVEKAKEVLGSNFDQSVFDQLVANQLVQKSDLLAYYDNLDKSATTKPAPAAAAAAAVDAAAPVAKADTNAKPQVQYAPDETTVDFKTLHSLVRWNKPEKRGELAKLLNTDAGAVVRVCVCVCVCVLWRFGGCVDGNCDKEAKFFCRLNCILL